MKDTNISISLDCDDDVVLFEKDTFKVSRLKELMRREVIKETHFYHNHLGQTPKFSAITIGEETVKFNYIKYEIIKDCQIIQVNNQGWQKGTLNIEICISTDVKKPDKINL
ncbi:KGK domain-containing protein [Calothrix sp. CCY 0018]|uniref:KGK domain-containing protein n=1 Tax=Calothrix sp. CCY 0018 TaxID=3103864 RepID=UPI0039C7333D